MFSRKVLTLLLFFASCSRGEPGQIIDGKVIVTADRVIVEEKKPTLSLAATLTPSAKVLFRFPFEIKVERVAVRLGESVAQGALLFELDATDLALKLASLKVKREEKKSLLTKNAYFFENRDRLLEEGKIDKTQYESLETEVNAGRQETERFTAEISEIESQLTDNTVRAPIDGIIAEMSVVNGAKIPANETALTLVRIDPIYVSFEVPAEEVASVSLGMNVDVAIEGFEGKNSEAPITFVNPELDPARKTLGVKASLPNNGYALKGGMQAQVHFTGQKLKKTLRVPAKALLKEGDKEYVYVVKENKVWPVRVFAKEDSDDPEMLEIQSGLKESDLVVTEGHQSLEPGVAVNLWR